MGVSLVALLWGFAEATLFFIVPDVWTSAAGLTNLKRGLLACCWALGGALVGGLLMYLWGTISPMTAMSALVMVPAINQGLITEVGDALASQGVTAMLLGPMSGIPYKLYAVQARAADISLVMFFLVSIPARLIRFMLVTVFIHVVGRACLAFIPVKGVYLLLGVAWLLFYETYFRVMSA